MKDIIVIGGGLGGLISAWLLANSGFEVLLIEKKVYPFHRVCGEYVSNEVVPFLKAHNLFPYAYCPSTINTFLFADPSGRSKTYPMDMGGFGISRYNFDYFLYKKCLEAGVESITDLVHEIHFEDNCFSVNLASGRTFFAPLVIGSFGKRSNLDKKMGRSFIKKRSPYVAVKYHIKTDFPEHQIAIHTFQGGYCGLVKIEEDRYNLCYLAKRELLKSTREVGEMEGRYLFQNPRLKAIFDNSDFLFPKPEVINEISFEPKASVEQHVLMAGDAAGMVAPIFGNGMAMSIRSAKLLADNIKCYYTKSPFNREGLENAYRFEWKKCFGQRLWLGRQVQRIFDVPLVQNFAISAILKSDYLMQLILKKSHGKALIL